MVLPPDAAFSRGAQDLSLAKATDTLRKRGDQPRFKQNRLLFVAADYDTVNRLKDQVRSWLAWGSIVSDISEMKLNLDQYQARQAKQSLDEANEALRRMVRETYKWLLAPMQEARPGKGLSDLQWEHFPLNPGAANWSQEIERVLKENELLITEWAPIHLASMLKLWFWKDGVKETNALNVWQQTCQQLYLPRLRDSSAFQSTLGAGADSTDFYGFAQGKEGDRYLGFSFGQRTTPILDTALLLIEPEYAASVAQALAPPSIPTNESTHVGPDGIGHGLGGFVLTGVSDNPNDLVTGGDTTPVGSVRNRFYATVDLDPINAKKQFADVVDEVVQQFTLHPGVNVAISVEIQAESSAGFDSGIQRAVKENCAVLKFKTGEFE